MSKTKEYYLEVLGLKTESLYDEIKCNLTEQEIYEAELLSEYARKANQI